MKWVSLKKKKWGKLAAVKKAWYDWLINYIPKHTRKVAGSFKDTVISLFKTNTRKQKVYGGGKNTRKQKVYGGGKKLNKSEEEEEDYKNNRKESLTFMAKNGTWKTGLRITNNFIFHKMLKKSVLCTQKVTI